MNKGKLIKGGIFILFLFLSMQQLVNSTPEPEGFTVQTTNPEIGEIGAKEIPLNIQNKGGVEVKEIDGYYRITSEKGGTVQLGDSHGPVLQIPSNSKILISKRVDWGKRRLLLYLNEDSSGKIGLSGLNEEFTLKIIFNDGDSVSFLDEKNVKLGVSEGALEIKKGKLRYNNVYSNNGLILEFNSKSKIDQMGISGNFRVLQEETDLVVGELEGNNLVVVSGNELNEKLGDNLVVFSDGFVNKFIKGNVKYKDNAYEFTLETDKALVEVKPNFVKFLGGKGKLKRLGDFSHSVVEVKDKKLLTQTVYPRYKLKKTENARTEIIVGVNDKFITISRNGILRDIKKKNSVDFNVYDSLSDIYEVSKFSSEQLKWYTSYLIGGTDGFSAGRLTSAGILPAAGGPFLKAGFSSGDIIGLVPKGVNLETAKTYLDAGAKPSEVFDLIEYEISPSQFIKYKDLGLEDNLEQVIKLDIPKKFIDDYQAVFKRYQRNLKGKETSGFLYPSFLTDGQVYARLFTYGIEIKQLEDYLNVLSEHNYQYSIPGGYQVDDFIEVIRLGLPPKTILQYFENGAYSYSDILHFLSVGVEPNKVKEYGKIVGGRGMTDVTYGVDLNELREYNSAVGSDLDYHEIAALKILEIKPEQAKEFSKKYNYYQDSPEFKKKYQEKIDELGLTEKNRYNLATLDIVSKNWKAEKTDKPVALVILNRNDWNGAFNNEDWLYNSLSSKYHLLITEASEDEGIRLQLGKANEKFGKIGLILIGGHGYQYGINLGKGDDDKSYLDSTDEDIFNAIKSSTKDDAVVVLQSCSTGKGDNPIADYIKTYSQRIVFAPICPANIQKFVFNDEGLKNVEYQGGVHITKKFKPETYVPEVKQLKTGK